MPQSVLDGYGATRLLLFYKLTLGVEVIVGLRGGVLIIDKFQQSFGCDQQLYKCVKKIEKYIPPIFIDLKIFCLQEVGNWGQLVISGLDPGYWYQLRITATNSAGATTAVYNMATKTIKGGKLL